MKRIIPLFAVILLFAGCKDEPKMEEKHGELLVLTTEATTLRDGDLVGVTMDPPFNYINVKTTFSNGTLTPDNPLYWPVNQRDSAVNFVAYYPYTAEFNDGGTVVFTAPNDQRQDADFRASDLMVALTKASVAEPSVNFDLTHKMAKLVLYVHNDSGSPVQDIWFTAYPSLQFNMDKFNFRVCGDKADIHSHLSASADGVDAYEAVIAPQNTSLVITVKTATAEYSVVLASTTTFQSGKQYSAVKLITLDEKKAQRAINITVQEADWNAAPDFVYQAPPAGGAALEDLTDPGLYKIEGGAALPLRLYEAGSDQFSLIKGGNARGWRIMDPILGEMFEFSAPTVYSTEGKSVDINIRSFGIEGFEADYSSTASVIMVDSGLAWLMDDKKDYGYIVATE